MFQKYKENEYTDKQKRLIFDYIGDFKKKENAIEQAKNQMKSQYLLIFGNGVCKL